MGTKKVQTCIFLLALSSFCSINPFVQAIRAPDQLNRTSKPSRKATELFGGSGGGVTIGGGGITIGGGGIIIGGDPTPATPTLPSPNCPTPIPPPPPPPAEPTRLEIAYKVIQEFKNEIKCDPVGVTQTWTGPNPCLYRGFRCAFLPKYKQQALYAVQFNELAFAGKSLSIDNFINKLPDVSIFHANSNNFSGKVPDISATKLPYLVELDLSNNKYEGEFPFSVLQATNLTYLDIRFNYFSGQVPPEVFTLDLVALFINNNNFEQELPSNLWSTPAAYVTLANNKFTGGIPTCIGTARTTLLEILFLNNQLSGCLPPEIGQLKKARVFDVEGNQLTGPIPCSYACLEDMQYLILARNQLYGPIPESICKLPKLSNLTLSNNYFTEVGPECMKLIEKKVMDVSGNCVPGLPNQKSEQECKKFLCKPKSCPEAQEIYCQKTAAYLSREVSMDPPHPQPTLTYSALAPRSD